MKIGIFAGNLLPIHAKTLEERPIGGMETAVIRLAENLNKIGHEVFVFTRHENPPTSSPRYLPLAQVEQSPPLDAFISTRDWIPLFYQVPAKKRFFWTGDSYDQFANYGIGDQRVVHRCDYFLAVSQWQADQICQRSGFPSSKVKILRNGVHLPFFEQKLNKKRKRLIYSSTPYRGLEFIPKLYRQLKEMHPDLELRVFSSYKIYDQNIDFKKLQDALKELPDVYYKESVTQQELAREFLEASILFYPCNFEETSCITAIEAMAAGCPVLTTRLGALPETLGQAGVFIEGPVGQKDYEKKFIEKADELLKNDSLFSSLSDLAKKQAAKHDWKLIADDFSKFLNEVIS